MKFNRILPASLIIIIIAFSFFFVTYLHQDNVIRTLKVHDVESTQSLMLSLPLMVGMGYSKDCSPLNQSTRLQIYTLVRSNPGIHFRGICNRLGLPVGVVQYHLGLLIRAGLLSVHRDRRYKRYFESKRFGETEMKIISLLRHETAGKILAILSGRGSVLHKDLALKLDISSQALTWQMNRLGKTGLIEAVREGMKAKYLLKEEKAVTVKRCLGLID